MSRPIVNISETMHVAEAFARLRAYCKAQDGKVAQGSTLPSHCGNKRRHRRLSSNRHDPTNRHRGESRWRHNRHRRPARRPRCSHSRPVAVVVG